MHSCHFRLFCLRKLKKKEVLQATKNLCAVYEDGVIAESFVNVWRGSEVEILV